MFACSWKQHLGIECPGCGAQRSFLELINGNILESIRLFPALIPLISTFVLTAIIIAKPSAFHPKWIVRFFSLSAFLMLGNWIIKLYY
jgi:Protein of unknown function (DUF2752)